MTVFEFAQRILEAPEADMEVVANVVADNMDYEFEDTDGRERCIGIDFDKNVEICDAYVKTVNGKKKMVISLFAL